MVHIVIIEGKYFQGVTECGRYAETTKFLSEAWMSDNRGAANEVAEVWGGRVKGFAV